jgi:hypothetical protein
MEEIWKDIEGYEGYYQISNLGRVKSLSRIINSVKTTYNSKEIILRNGIASNGYEFAILCVNYKKVKISIHRFVAIYFIENPKNKPCVNHINGIKTDNKVENLEWVTYSENSYHAVRTGLLYNSDFQRFRAKEANGIKVINKLNNRVYSSIIDAAKDYKMDNSTLAKMLKGKALNTTPFIYHNE